MMYSAGAVKAAATRLQFLKYFGACLRPLPLPALQAASYSTLKAEVLGMMCVSASCSSHSSVTAIASAGRQEGADAPALTTARLQALGGTTCKYR
eukprot:scaffold140541_cov16-Tisochrysis_lutea.AAC.1